MLDSKELLARSLEDQYFVGVVESNNDSNLVGGKKGRIQVRVTKYFDKVSIENLPWALPSASLSNFDVPRIGQKVWVKFQRGNLSFPVYYGILKQEGEVGDILEEDYPHTRGFYDGKNWVTMNSRTGKISIHNSEAEIVLSGSGSMSITVSSDINVNSSGDVNFSSTGTLSIESDSEISLTAPIIRNN